MRLTTSVSIWIGQLLVAAFITTATAAPPPLPAPKMTFLDNGEVKIGMDLSLGGAVTYISSKTHPANIINSADLGRQIQMSHYSGPWPFEVGDRKPRKEWAGLGWNPIQTGDCFNNPSKVLEHRNDGRELYIKCIPMQWPLSNVPGDCVFETWTTLNGPVIQMRYRCTNHREDTKNYGPCPQELPAVYTISKLSRLMSYTGEKPFTGDALTHVTNNWRSGWPWTRFLGTERWAALVNDKSWGLGVFKEDGGEFHGGVYGDGRSDDPKDGSTSYVAPIHRENFDHNITYEHRTTFVVGTLEEIRSRCNALASRTLPAWHFDRDRQHWTLRNGTDAGFPLNKEWRIKVGAAKPHLERDTQFWRAEAAPTLVLKLAHAGEIPAIRVFWRRLDDANFDDKKSAILPLNPDAKSHSYQLKLADSPEYRGLITALAIETVDQPPSGTELILQSIELQRPGK